MAGYFPITIAVTKNGFARSVVARAADRFGRLNGARPRVITRPPNGAPVGVHPAFYKAWLWDMVPRHVDRIMFIDYDIIPIRPLGEVPDCVFGASMGRTAYPGAAQLFPYYRRSGKYFNTGFFLAHRSTQPIFEQLKSFASSREASLMRHMEQCTLNLLLQPAVKVLELSDEWNYQPALCEPFKIDEPKMLHFSALGDRRWQLMSFLLNRLDSAELGTDPGAFVSLEEPDE